MEYINSQLQADKFAQSLNSTVVVPDLFNGDAISPDAFKKGSVDLAPWLKRHDTERIDPIVEKTIKYLKEEKGFKSIGAVGYCFGAKVSCLRVSPPFSSTSLLIVCLRVKYVVRFLEARRSQSLDVGYIAHPSFVTHDELAAVQKPLSISASGTYS
jgi:Dienelactone hydrolase family